MNRFCLFPFLLVLLCLSAKAQHQEVSEKPEIWKGKNNQKTADSAYLLHVFKNGHFSGHFRYFSMATNNAIPLSDYYANALGGGLKFETAELHHFQFGVSGFYIFNIGSSDFSIPDSLTKSNNRYEWALFDITNAKNKTNLDRLEELYLKYHRNKFSITAGRQLINTPFINLQDGRMRPTEVQGVWTEIQWQPNIKMEGGILTHISPRSTLEFYNIGASIGLYSSGVNTDGSKSNYANHVTSNYIAIIGLSSTPIKNMKWQFWNQYVDHVFNTSMIQVEYEKIIRDHHKISIGGQSIFQLAVKNRTTVIEEQRYIQEGSKSFTYGARLGYKNAQFESSFNYNRITSTGRYLMPREWGRDPFYTFLPRERNEGFGDVHAFVIKVGYPISKSKLKTNIALGYFNLPSVNNYTLNKYSMPSYGQLNVDLRYAFHGFLQGLDAQFLWAYKMNAKENITNKIRINKVDMHNLNLILNYHF